MRIVGEAGVQCRWLGGEDRGKAAEFVEQLIDDRAGMGRAERLEQIR